MFCQPKFMPAALGTEPFNCLQTSAVLAYLLQCFAAFQTAVTKYENTLFLCEVGQLCIGQRNVIFSLFKMLAVIDES